MCRFCKKHTHSLQHEEKCWLNPENMHIVLRLIARQIESKSSFYHLHYAINIKPIDNELRKLKKLSLKTILKRAGVGEYDGEERLYYFIKFAVANGFCDVDIFPPHLLYIIDGWHCYSREEGQWRVDKAIEIEDMARKYVT